LAGSVVVKGTAPRAPALARDRQDSITIENSFIWKTKVEVFEELCEKPESTAIRYTRAAALVAQRPLNALWM
jgi:hypothetical protein